MGDVVIRLRFKRFGARTGFEPGDGASMRRNQAQIVPAGLDGAVKMYARGDAVVFGMDDAGSDFRGREADFGCVLQIGSADGDVEIRAGLPAVGEDPPNFGPGRWHLLREKRGG